VGSFGLHTRLFAIFLVPYFRSNTVSFESHKVEVLETGTTSNCILCGILEESATHLFLNCEVTSNVWRKVFTWFVIDFLTPPDLFVHLDC
jgi:hypothetical protein